MTPYLICDIISIISKLQVIIVRLLLMDFNMLKNRDGIVLIKQLLEELLS